MGLVGRSVSWSRERAGPSVIDSETEFVIRLATSGRTAQFCPRKLDFADWDLQCNHSRYGIHGSSHDVSSFLPKPRSVCTRPLISVLFWNRQATAFNPNPVSLAEMQISLHLAVKCNALLAFWARSFGNFECGGRTSVFGSQHAQKSLEGTFINVYKGESAISGLRMAAIPYSSGQVCSLMSFSSEYGTPFSI